MPATTCIVQARTGSTRLPGKVLAPVGGEPMLGFMLRRLSGLAVDHLVVATSDAPRDDPVAEIAAGAGVSVVRGSEADVLDRFRQAVEAFPADTVIRLTGDCPLVDPALVMEVLELHRRREAHYTSNVLPRSFPKGLDVEVVSQRALLDAAHEATAKDEREHVMPFLYRRPERFVLANLLCADDLGDLRWTVDTAADLELVRAVVQVLDDPRTAGWRQVLAAMGGVAEPAPSEVRLVPARSSDAAYVGGLRQWRGAPGPPPAQDLSDPGARVWVARSSGERLGAVRLPVHAGVGTVVVGTADASAEAARLVLDALDAHLVDDHQAPLLVTVAQPADEMWRRALEAAGFVATETTTEGIRFERRG